MNRNVESHFSRIPQMHHQRSSFDRSSSNTTTADFGEIFPVYCQEVLPGDTVQMKTSKVVRLQTLLAPVYSNAYFDTYWFFVPNRLLWRHWKEFMGENTSSAWVPSVTYKMPCIASPTGGFARGTLADYLGWPVGIKWYNTDPGAPCSLPLRAYGLIINQFFRDQNLQDPVVTDDSDNDSTGVNDRGLGNYIKGCRPYIACKYHDYFTSCLPAPAKGVEVNILGNLKGKIPVIPGKEHEFSILAGAAPDYAYVAPTARTAGTPSVPGQTYALMSGTGSPPYIQGMTPSYDSAGFPYHISGDGEKSITLNNLWAMPELGETSGLDITVNALRLSVLTQMYYEALARSGSRYEEQIEQFFGVTNPDSRMQHPEYLGGNRIPLNIHEITNTAQSEQDFLGDIGAKSATSDSHDDFVHSFSEHGWLMCLCVARYEHLFSQGMPAQYTRKTKFDFYNPMFARIGEQPVKTYELYATTQTLNSDRVFGYNEAWASYRYVPNMVTGQMRPNSNTGNFAHWTFGDNYTNIPTLSDGWIKEDKSNVDRCLAVTSTLANQLFVDFYFKTTWTRPIPMYSVPGAIGQF